MNKNILQKLKILQTEYKSIGFLLIGVFGSYSRNDHTNNSDIDILYDIDKKFLIEYKGWEAISKLESIKDEIKSTLNIFNVDLASIDNNSSTFQNTIKNELTYV